ncbi:MAG: hypothetical protein P8Y53_06575 [Pseudolabrys sp.]
MSPKMSPKMSRKTAFVLLGLLTAANAVALAVNLSTQARAAIASMSYKQLLHDKDFTRAVKSVVEGCKLNVDLGKLSC